MLWSLISAAQKNTRTACVRNMSENGICDGLPESVTFSQAAPSLRYWEEWQQCLSAADARWAEFGLAGDLPYQQGPENPLLKAESWDARGSEPVQRSAAWPLLAHAAAAEQAQQPRAVSRQSGAAVAATPSCDRHSIAQRLPQGRLPVGCCRRDCPGRPPSCCCCWLRP